MFGACLECSRVRRAANAARRTMTHVETAVSKIGSKDGGNIAAAAVASIHDNLFDLSEFRFERILSNNADRKVVCLQGSFTGHDGLAVLILEKVAFGRSLFEEECGFFDATNLLEQVFKNDIYGSYTYQPPRKLNGIKTTVIHPATEKHLAKYSSQRVYLVQETPAVYQKVVLPFIEDELLHLQWAYNILEGKCEADRVIFKDDRPKVGFLLLPDLKWDSKDIETLHYLALPFDRTIKSLRDLTSDHLPLLKNILHQSIKAIEEHWNLPASQLRAYVHYQPTFYLFHVHFTRLGYDAPGIATERAHLFSTVIDNLELLGDYYQKATLPFTVTAMSSIFGVLEKNGYVKRLEN